MNWHWASCSIAILALAATSASPAPRAANPCKQMRHTLDRQIDDLKAQQKDELQQCELSNGEGSDECLLLKDRQKQDLRAMRDNRTLQMRNCSGGWSFAGPAAPIVVDLNPSCVNQSYSEYPDNNKYPYPDNDKYPPRIRDPHHRHYPPRQPTETAAKAGPVNKATQVSEKSSGKAPRANTLTADSTGRNTASSAGRSYGARNESTGSHASSSVSSAGGSSLHSGNAGSFGSSASSHSSGGGSSFSGGSSASHSSPSPSAPASAPSSSASNSSSGHH